MHNITLLSTVHHQAGECNSIALYKILNGIKPDVIFEEIPASLFSQYYVERSKSTLETNAISMYVNNFKAANIPVDIDDMPDADFFSSYQNAMEQVLALADIDGSKLGTLMRMKKHYTYSHGFSFLNSEDHIRCSEEVNRAIERGLEKINDEKSILAFQRWNMFCDRRENSMLENIYNYSSAHNYSRGLFLLGASHRKSIKEKIETYQLNGLPELDWVFYGD